MKFVSVKKKKIKAELYNNYKQRFSIIRLSIFILNICFLAQVIFFLFSKSKNLSKFLICSGNSLQPPYFLQIYIPKINRGERQIFVFQGLLDVTDYRF